MNENSKLIKVILNEFEIDNKHQLQNQTGHMINSSLISLLLINETADWCKNQTYSFSSQLHYLQIDHVVILSSFNQSDKC